MSQTIKVHRLSEEGLEATEVSPEEATRLIEEAYAQGHVVVDRETGNVIDDLDPDTKEIILVATIAGG